MVVGIERFELSAFCSRSRRATRLRYIPNEPRVYKEDLKDQAGEGRFFKEIQAAGEAEIARMSDDMSQWLLSNVGIRNSFGFMQSPTQSRLTPLRLLLAALIFVVSMSWTSCTHVDGYQHLAWVGAAQHQHCSCDHDHEAKPQSGIECDAPHCHDQLIAAHEFAPSTQPVVIPASVFTSIAQVVIAPRPLVLPCEGRTFLGCTDPPPPHHLEFLSGIQQLI